jgi:hypothetical protein
MHLDILNIVHHDRHMTR